MTEIVLPHMADEILSDQELAEITGCAYKSAQAEWLTDAGWVFHVNALGHCVVGRFYAQIRLSGRAIPNFTGLFGAAQPPKVERVHWRRLPQHQARLRTELEQANREQADEAERMAAAKLEAERTRPERRAALVRHHAAKRRTAKMNRTPPWADVAAIRAFYDEAARLTKLTGEQHHVDHIIPLQGKLVSGLHVENNLQVIPWLENIVKRNKFEAEE